MAEFAPLFDNNTLPKNTQPLTNSEVTDALVSTTIGAAAGASTTKTRTQIQQPTTPLTESKRNLAATSLINRNSTATDVTALKSKFTKKSAQFIFPADKSGNGGPSFTRV